MTERLTDAFIDKIGGKFCIAEWRFVGIMVGALTNVHHVFLCVSRGACSHSAQGKCISLFIIALSLNVQSLHV